MTVRVKQVWKVDASKRLELPLANATVQAGFPSPAHDFSETSLDLNNYLIRHPAATFFVRVQGESMKNVGIFDGDILIVDKALEPYDGSIVIACVDDEFTVKRLQIRSGRHYLVPENPDFSPILLEGDMTLQIFGVVTHCIHSF